MVVGAACAGLGMILIATAQGTPALVAGVLLAGASPALCVAPFADAAAMMVGEGRRDRVLSVVSTGTTLGLAAAGPVVLLIAAGGPADSGQGWRYAWAAFAAVAFLVALWNARLLPGEPYRGTVAADGAGKEGLLWFLRYGSSPLLGQAFLYGMTGAFYYTYAVDLAQQSGLGGPGGRSCGASSALQGRPARSPATPPRGSASGVAWRPASWS